MILTSMVNLPHTACHLSFYKISNSGSNCRHIKITTNSLNIGINFILKEPLKEKHLHLWLKVVARQNLKLKLQWIVKSE
jgi:hypothetical protein